MRFPVLLLLAACQGRPLPEGYQLPNQGPAVEAVASFFEVSPPAVEFLDRPEGELAIDWLGRPFAGMHSEGSIWLVLWPSDVRYSATSLCHETAHWKHGDGGHTHPEVWGLSGQVATCIAALASRLELDTIDRGAARGRSSCAGGTCGASGGAQNGNPRHPLMLSETTELVAF